MILPLDNQKQRHPIALAINIGNCYSLFPIPWLNYLTSTTLVCPYNDYYRADNTYYKACFVEVIEIGIRNPVFRPYILY